jgi:hypothetical protein
MVAVDVDEARHRRGGRGGRRWPAAVVVTIIAMLILAEVVRIIW